MVSTAPDGNAGLVAVTRDVSPNFSRCEITYLPRTEIRADVARAQHQEYERLLQRLGCEVVSLPADPELPDSVFVEDVAIVLDEVAIITRPGAPSRRPEPRAVASALATHRPLASVAEPGTLDGGDVLRVGRTLWVGLSGRSDAAGIAQLAALTAPHGYVVRPVAVRGCLHLKSAVTAVAPDTLLLQPSWVDSAPFTGLRIVEVDPDEPHAANALLVGSAVVYGASHPRTRERLERLGLDVRSVDVSEIEKAEGAVTCCSLIFQRLAPE